MERTIPLTISVSCDRCGSGNIDVPDAAGSLDPLVCIDCGTELGSRAELDRQIDAQIRAQVAEEFKRMLHEHRARLRPAA